MADTLARRSPLQDFTSRFAAAPDSARIVEEPFVTMVDLWVDGPGPSGVAAAQVLGVDALPSTPSTVVAGPDTNVIWFGPQEWLITSTSRDGEALEVQLREAISERGGAAVDVSAQRTTVRLRGTHSRDILAKGCSIDLHPSVFAPGTAMQTMIGQASVVLIPLSDNGADFQVIVRSSFARYLGEWLIDSAEEFTLAEGLRPA